MCRIVLSHSPDPCSPKDNAHRWSKKQVKATEKAWGCRHSRESKDKCRK